MATSSLETLDSGVPALVTDEGGPQFIVKSGITGYICGDNASFVDCIQKLKQSPDELQVMKQRARKQAESASWDSVFAAVYRAYEAALEPSAPVGANLGMKVSARAQAQP